MKFIDYIIKYNLQFGQDECRAIDVNKVDYSEDETLCSLMERYISMLKEKYERKQVARCDETFELSGMSEDERYVFDSVAGTYIYENQFERKEIQQEIAELSGLSRKQVSNIAKVFIGEIKPATIDEKYKVAKMLVDNESEPNA